MRIGLISALNRTEAGGLRAELSLAGRSVLAWQVDLLRTLGVERVLCLCDGATGEVLRLQHEVEAVGAAFHALKGFAALPALVRAEDELIILRDGLVPDPVLARALVETGRAPPRVIVCLPTKHPLAIAHPEDFERIDAERHWAGVLVMRGAPVQRLADFSADSDGVSVLLRLALQAATPIRELTADELLSETWLLAQSARAVAVHEQALIARAASGADWRTPLAALAAVLVRRFVPLGLTQGARIAAGVGLVLMLGGMVAAALGPAVGGLTLAAAGAFSGDLSRIYAALRLQLWQQSDAGRGAAAIDMGVDALAALTLWFALSPASGWTPLAVCGPLVIGLARLAARERCRALAAIASDRASLLLVLALAAGFGILPEAVAVLALALAAALLLRTGSH